MFGATFVASSCHENSPAAAAHRRRRRGRRGMDAEAAPCGSTSTAYRPPFGSGVGRRLHARAEARRGLDGRVDVGRADVRHPVRRRRRATPSTPPIGPARRREHHVAGVSFPGLRLPADDLPVELVRARRVRRHTSRAKRIRRGRWRLPWNPPICAENVDVDASAKARRYRSILSPLACRRKRRRVRPRGPAAREGRRPMRFRVKRL